MVASRMAVAFSGSSVALPVPDPSMATVSDDGPTSAALQSAVQDAVTVLRAGRVDQRSLSAVEADLTVQLDA